MVCRHAVIIGLDGLRGPALREASAPRISALLAEGVKTYSAQTVSPSSSFPAWGAMFHGVGPEKHQITGEAPCPINTPWPSFLQVARQAWPEARLASFCCWEPINSLIIEQSIGCDVVSLPDPELVSATADYLRNAQPTMFFMQLDFIDGAGHRYGYRSPEYLAQITETDTRVGTVLEAVRQAGMYEQSLIVLLSDHGGYERSHGSDHPDCMTTLWGCAGPGIAAGVELDGRVDIMDTAAVVARALGLQPPPGWDARVPAGIWLE